MKKIITILCFLNIYLIAHPTNHFIIENDFISLQCEDLKSLKKISDNIVDIEYSKIGTKKMYDFSKNHFNKEMSLIADNTKIFTNLKILNILGEQEFSKNETSGITFYSENGKVDNFINTFKHCKKINKAQDKDIPSQEGILSLKSKNEFININCEDVKKIRGVAFKDDKLKLYFTEKGITKFCKFNKNNINTEISVLLNNEKISSKLIKKQIDCYKSDFTIIGIDSINKIHALRKSLCINPND